MRRPLLPVLLVLSTLLVGCRRDFDVADPPSEGARPPVVTHAELLDVPRAAPSVAELPVLGGELVVLQGEALEAAQPLVGGEPALVLEAGPTRLLFEVPVSPALGVLPLVLDAPDGRVELPALLRLDGVGAPTGWRTGVVPTQAPLRRIAEVRLTPDAEAAFRDDATFSSLVVTAGSADTAELLLGASGAGLLSIPLGVVPQSVAGVVSFTNDLRLEVTAYGVDRAGRIGRGAVRMARGGGLTLLAPEELDLNLGGLTEISCEESTELLATSDGSRLAVAFVGGASTRLIGLDPARPRQRTITDVPGRLKAWQALPDGRSVVAFLAGAEVPFVRFDTLAGTISPFELGGRPLEALVEEASCAATIELTALAVTPDGAQVAVAYDVEDQIGEVALFDGADGRLVARGAIAPGIVPLSFARIEGAEALFAVAAFGLNRLVMTPATTAPWEPTCSAVRPPGLEVDAVAQLPAEQALLAPPIGGLVAVRGGLHSSRLLALGSDGAVRSFFASTLSAMGEVYRPAPYGRLSVASVGAEAAQILLAEHTSPRRDTMGIDVAATVLAVPLDGRERVAIGPSAQAHGVATVETELRTTVVLAASSQLPVDGAPAALPDGIGTLKERCEGLDLKMSTSPEPPARIVQGPALEGRLGPDGVGRHGPAEAPIWHEAGGVLYAHATATAAACVGDGQIVSCEPTGELSLELPPGTVLLDVTPSAGDRTFALRTLSLERCSSSCVEEGCAAQNCPVVHAISLRGEGRAPLEVALPARPVSVAADRAGGFFVTLACGGRREAEECLRAAGCEGRELTSRRDYRGALLHVDETTGEARCLASASGLGGVVQPTPNGRELWVAGPDDAAEFDLLRLTIPRSLTDGRVDPAQRVDLLGRERLGPGTAAPPGFAASGLAFTPDGAQGFVSVPAASAILTYE